MNGYKKMMSGSAVMAISASSANAAAKMKLLAEITKAHLTLYVALSAVLGHVISMAGPGADTLVLGAGVWLLAAGAAVGNNIQDRTYDTHFVRTCNRILPRKKIAVNTAGALAAACSLAGLGILFLCFHQNLPWMLGILALVCYNGLYTPLKKKTVLAVLPGIVCGMLPPAIGWTAGIPETGDTGFQTIFLLMLVMGIWQVPHFLMLDARQMPLDVHSMAFPRLGRMWTITEHNIQVLLWTGLYSQAVFLFVIKGSLASDIFSIVLAGIALVLPVCMAIFPKWFLGRRAVPGFYAVNLSMLMFMTLGIVDHMLV